MRKKVIIKIYGKVQGVFFRDSSRMKARELNLVGFAVNEPDGIVKIVTEGPEENLKKMIEWCKKGPYNAEVKKVEVEWLEPGGEYDDFVIL